MVHASLQANDAPIAEVQLLSFTIVSSIPSFVLNLSLESFSSDLPKLHPIKIASALSYCGGRTMSRIQQRSADVSMKQT